MLKMCSTLLLVGLLLTTGCFEGLKVKNALTQQQSFVWGTDGNFSNTSVGTHELGSTMMEGNIVLNDDGTIDWSESRITHYLKVEPKADVAGGAMAAALMASTQQIETMGNTLQTLTATLLPALMQMPRAPGSTADPPT